MSFSLGAETRRGTLSSDSQFRLLNRAYVYSWRAKQDRQSHSRRVVRGVKIDGRKPLRPYDSKSGVPPPGRDLHQLRLGPGLWHRRRHRHGLQVLRRAPIVQNADLLHARNRAHWRAKFSRKKLAPPHLRRVLLQRDPRITPLLRAPVHQAVLANVQIPRARPAPPVILPPARHVMLKLVEPRERPLAQRHDLFEDLDLSRPQRFQLPVVVVNDPDRARQPQFHRAVRDAQRVLRILHAASQHGIDVHLEIRVLPQQLEFLIQRFQALLGNLVWHRVVDADLQVLQPRAVQLLDALFRQQKSVRDHSRDHAAPPDVPDNLVQLRVQQWFAPADGDDGSPHARQDIQAFLHLLHGHRLRKIVEFVAIRARQVASPRGDDVHQEGMLRRNQCFRNRAQFARARVEEALRAPEPHLQRGLRFPESLSHESLVFPSLYYTQRLVSYSLLRFRRY